MQELKHSLKKKINIFLDTDIKANTFIKSFNVIITNGRQ